MRRRAILGAFGAAGIWPLAAQAQQQIPVIGYLDFRSAEAAADRLRGFHRGLKESGFVEGENVAIVYRWAEGHAELLPGLAADLVRRKVRVIASLGGAPSTLAAKEATGTIPIVFAVPGDPVQVWFPGSRVLTAISRASTSSISKSSRSGWRCCTSSCPRRPE